MEQPVGAEAASAKAHWGDKSGVLARRRVFHRVPLMVMARHTEAVFLKFFTL